MRPTKFRWSRVYESNEEELHAFLEARGIVAQRVYLEEFAQTPGTVPDTDTVLYCADGSMTVVVDTDKLAAQPGDAIRIVANQSYYIDAGFAGCVYYLAA